MRKTLPDNIFLQMATILDGKRQFPFPIQDLNGSDSGKAVFLHRAVVILGMKAFSLIGRVAFHDRSPHLLNQWTDQIGGEKMVSARFTAGKLHGNVSAKFASEKIIQLHQCFRCDRFGKINL